MVVRSCNLQHRPGLADLSVNLPGEKNNTQRAIGNGHRQDDLVQVYEIASFHTPSHHISTPVHTWRVRSSCRSMSSLAISSCVLPRPLALPPPPTLSTPNMDRKRARTRSQRLRTPVPGAAAAPLDEEVEAEPTPAASASSRAVRICICVGGESQSVCEDVWVPGVEAAPLGEGAVRVDFASSRAVTICVLWGAKCQAKTSKVCEVSHLACG